MTIEQMKMPQLGEVICAIEVGDLSAMVEVDATNLVQYRDSLKAEFK